MTPHPILCTIVGCERPHKARGWCATHYSRWARHGSPTLHTGPVRRIDTNPAHTHQAVANPHHLHREPCRYSGCDATALNRGLCDTHHLHWVRTGD